LRDLLRPLLQRAATLPNVDGFSPDNIGLFHRFYFDMRTYPVKPVHLVGHQWRYSIGNQPVEDKILMHYAMCTAAVKLCSECRDWGIQRGVDEFLGNDWQRLAEDKLRSDDRTKWVWLKSMCRRLIARRRFMRKRQAVVQMQAAVQMVFALREWIGLREWLRLRA